MQQCKSFFIVNTIRDIKGDTISFSFRDGFLGIFGRKVNLEYKNGDYYEFGTNNVYNGDLPNHFGRIRTDLQNLDNNPISSGILNDLIRGPNVRIKGGSYSYNSEKRILYIGSGGADASFNQGGAGFGGASTSYLATAHELYHAWDHIINGGGAGGQNFITRWEQGNGINDIPIAEIFATHFENQIRAGDGLPLREFYSSNNGVFGGVILIPGTRTNINLQHINRGLDVHRAIIPFTY